MTGGGEDLGVGAGLLVEFAVLLRDFHDDSDVMLGEGGGLVVE